MSGYEQSLAFLYQKSYDKNNVTIQSIHSQHRPALDSYNNYDVMVGLK